ncbi:MAG TPA: four helix bundle protein [Candidatus Omnitrophota bacterium]|nr:four helix bundle protein [Candidatus Omnitrophota bacterium]
MSNPWSWETDEERLLRFMKIPVKRKLEWLHEIHQINVKYFSKRMQNVECEMEDKMARIFDLEERTTKFAKEVIRMCKVLPRGPINDRLISQVVGSSGSVGANYREANDALGKNDFLQRLRISRREAKECHHWLDLISEANSEKSIEIKLLLKEAAELRNILSAIIKKVEN